MATRRKIVSAGDKWVEATPEVAKELIPEPTVVTKEQEIPIIPQELVKVKRYKGRKPGVKMAKFPVGYIPVPAPKFTPQSNPVYISVHRALDTKRKEDFTEAVMDFRLFFRDKDCSAMAILFDVHKATVRKWLVGTHVPTWPVRYEMLLQMLWYVDLSPGDRIDGLFKAEIPEDVEYELDWVLVRHRKLLVKEGVANSCGHFVVVNGMEYRVASSEHPTENEDPEEWAKKFVAKILGESKVKDISWSGCLIHTRTINNICTPCAVGIR